MTVGSCWMASVLDDLGAQALLERVDVDRAGLDDADLLHERQQAAHARGDVGVPGQSGHRRSARRGAARASAGRRRRNVENSSGPIVGCGPGRSTSGVIHRASSSCSGAGGNVIGGAAQVALDEGDDAARSQARTAPAACSRPDRAGTSGSTARRRRRSRARAGRAGRGRGRRPGRTGRCSSRSPAPGRAPCRGSSPFMSTPTTCPLGTDEVGEQQGDVAGAAADVEHLHPGRDAGGGEELAGDRAVDLVLADQPRRLGLRSPEGIVVGRFVEGLARGVHEPDGAQDRAGRSWRRPRDLVNSTLGGAP